MRTYGLIGYPLGHSFSQGYFSEKFKVEGIYARYLNFSIESVDMFPGLLEKHPYLGGLNVTIPYKESIIPYLDDLDETAKAVGAVNVIKFDRSTENLRLIGYNSDVIGFENSLKPLLNSFHQKALILGTGGAAKAVAYVLEKLGIKFTYVSRREGKGILTYEELSPDVMRENLVIINTTPLGMHPKVEAAPVIPYQMVTPDHLLFDLVYNPEKTQFLLRGEEQGAVIKNGLEMLHLQAEGAWDIWNK